MMVASLLEREGVRCPLVTSADALSDLGPEAGAVVVGKKLRLIPAADIRTEVSTIGSALRAIDTKRI